MYFLKQIAWICTEPDTCQEFGTGMLIFFTLLYIIIGLAILFGIMLIAFLIRLIFTKKRLVGQYGLLIAMLVTLTLIAVGAEFLGAGVLGLFYGLPVLGYVFLIILTTYALSYSILHSRDEGSEEQSQQYGDYTEEIQENPNKESQDNQQTIYPEEH